MNFLKSLTVPEKTERGDLVSSSFVCYAKKGTFKVQFPGPKGTIWSLKFCRTSDRTILNTSGVSKNKTRTSKVGAISKAQKAQTFFLEKHLKFFSFKKCHIVPKNVKGGTLLDLLTNITLQNIKKLKGGTLWGH